MTTVPTTIATTIERDATTVAPPGSSTPNDVISAARPRARPMPSTVPIAEATTPTTTDSATIMRSTCLRLEPMARSIAVSLVRCATVIEKALKITNPPTTRATTANTSRNVLMNDMPCWLSVRAASTAAVPGDHLDAVRLRGRRQRRATRAASSDCVTPGRADRAHAVDATGLAQHAHGRGRRRERHDARATGVVVGPVGRDAGDGVLRRTGLA